MFQLDKWYLDVVTDEGTVLILYAARVEWGRAGVEYASALHLSGSGRRDERSSFRRSERPRVRGDSLTWRSAPLCIAGTWLRDAPPIRRTLASDPHGEIRWTCHMPRARATVSLGDEEISGLGYVERLRVTVPPSRLPFRTLRWGRHLSPEHSLVWIDWAGGGDRRWVWLDGDEQSGTAFSIHAPSRLGGGRELRLHGSRDVRNRHVLEALAGIPPVLTRRLAGGIARMHEHKQVSRSSIVLDGAVLDEGWALHEVVTR